MPAWYLRVPGRRHLAEWHNPPQALPSFGVLSLCAPPCILQETESLSPPSASMSPFPMPSPSLALSDSKVGLPFFVNSLTKRDKPIFVPYAVSPSLALSHALASLPSHPLVPPSRPLALSQFLATLLPPFCTLTSLSPSLPLLPLPLPLTSHPVDLSRPPPLFPALAQALSLSVAPLGTSLGLMFLLQ